MSLRKLFGLQFKKQEPYAHADVMHMWEDDYLMIELVSIENLEFLKKEIRRMEHFAKEHFNGLGFDNITHVREKPVSTIKKEIRIEEVAEIFRNTGLQRVDKAVKQNVGILEFDRAQMGYGSHRFAVILEGSEGFLKDIWIIGRTKTEAEKKKLRHGLSEFGERFNFIGVDWFRFEYYLLNDQNQAQQFVENSC